MKNRILKSKGLSGVEPGVKDRVNSKEVCFIYLCEKFPIRKHKPNLNFKIFVW